MNIAIDIISNVFVFSNTRRKVVNDTKTSKDVDIYIYIYTKICFC